MAEVKSVGELIDQARQLDSDIVTAVRHLQGHLGFVTRDHLLQARERLADAVNELLKAL